MKSQAWDSGVLAAEEAGAWQTQAHSTFIILPLKLAHLSEHQTPGILWFL